MSSNQVIIFCALSVLFFVVKAQKCNTCAALKVECGLETDKLFNGIVDVVYGKNAKGCRTMRINCTDDLVFGDASASSMVTVNDGEITVTEGTMVTCNEDGSWFGKGLNAVVCQVNRNLGDTKPIEKATCKKAENIRNKRAIPEASGCISEWSNWVTSAPCPDYCGACFNSTYTRTCMTSATCPCTGPSTFSKACNQNVCGYPRKSCCNSLKAVSSFGEVVCSTTAAANQPDSDPDTITVCPPEGIWSTWIEVCNGTCGGYGIGTRRRSCLTSSAGCPCTGESVQTSAPCLLLPCIDRAPCALGLTLAIESGLITCAKTIIVTKPITTCPPFGVWEHWGAWSSCASACGGCSQATRTRTCASTKYGCPCDNSITTDTQPCNRIACTSGTQCCSPLVPFTLSNGDTICYPASTVIPDSTPTTTSATVTTTTSTTATGWSEWAASSCTASCGLCGKTAMTRTCLGGSCPGLNFMTSTQTCGGAGLCPAGLNLPSCCAPATRAVVNSAFTCVLPSA